MEAQNFPCSLATVGQFLSKGLSCQTVLLLILWQEKTGLGGREGILSKYITPPAFSPGYKRDKKKTQETPHHALP